MTLYLIFPSPLPLSLNSNSYKICNTGRCCNLFITHPLKQQNRKRCYNSNTQNEAAGAAASSLLDGGFVSDVSAAKDANQVLDMVADKTKKKSGTLSNSDCALIIGAALGRNNADLALSVFSSMRSTLDPGEQVIERWRWPRPDVRTYTLLVQGLAASLRVSDALQIIRYVCRLHSSPAQEVSFGKVIKCPSCKVAVAVAQPQYGIQACIIIVNMFILCRVNEFPKGQKLLILIDIRSSSSEESTGNVLNDCCLNVQIHRKDGHKCVSIIPDAYD